MPDAPPTVLTGKRKGWSTLAHDLLQERAGASREAGGGMEFGDYFLEEEIARGGMGIVYRAQQISLDRTVAVKVMKEGLFAAGREVERFRQEASAAAALQHPGIVPVYESGECEGRFFYAMEWIAGPNLAEVTRERPAAARQAAQWVLEVAEAMQHAHAHGVVHRDLKPANVMLDDAGRARVTDFGMAQRADTAGGLTLSGQMLGTPGYMAPEVAGGNARTAGAAADIYGLGALLFHLLTGRAPFIGESHATILRQLADAEPVSPRLLNGSVPRDVETVCLKALHREPPRRYATAQDMADDLARYLHGEPVRARPVSRLESAWRWCRRKPALAASLTAVLLLGAGIVFTTLRSRRRIEGLRREAVERLYASDMRLALQNIAEGKYGAAAALVERHEPGAEGEDLRGFEWRLAREFCRGGERAALETMDGPVRVAGLSSDGRWLAAGADNLRVWEVNGAVPVLRGTVPDKTRALAFAPAGRRLAVSFAGGEVRILDAENITPALFTAHLAEPAEAMAWRADGTALEMIAGRRQWRWSPGQGEPVAVTELPSVPRLPSFSAGAQVAGYLHEPQAGEAWRLAVRDTVAGRGLGEIPVPLDRVLRTFGFSADGAWLATGDYSGRLALRAAPFDRESWDEVVHRGMVTALAFSPDGKVMASAGDQVIRLMDMASHYPRGILRGHRGMIDALAISPDGKQVLSGDQSGAVKWWDRPAPAQSGDIPADGGLIASMDGAALCWEWGVPLRIVLALPGQAPVLTGVARGERVPVLTRRECLLFSRNAETRTALRVTPGGPPAGEIIALPGPLECCSPDGRWLVVRVPETELLTLLDRTGARAPMTLSEEARPAAPVFSDDGSLCALGYRTGEVRVLATATGAEVCRVQAHRGWAYQAAFSRDGQRLATVGFDGRARLWKVADGSMVREFVSSADTLWCVALSPDGARIAAGTGESTVILWDTASGLETGTIPLGPPQRLVETLVFTPDGAALIVHGRLLRAP